MDGWITIGTKVDQSGLERDLKASQQKLKQFDKDNELLTKKKAKIEVDLQEYENAKRQIEEMTNKELEYAQTEGQVNQLLALEKQQLEELNNKYGGKLQAESEISKEIEKNNYQRQLELGKVEKINQELQKQKGLSSIKAEINDIGKGITSTIKKVTGWGLALFGIRGAYSMISRSMSIISQYDKQLGADIKYISYALAMTLKPLVEWLVKAMMTLLQYINYIANAWFGVNLFKNSGVQEFQKSMGASEKSAKNIEKSIASFDEVNKLSDTSSASSGSGGAVGPSMDLSKLSDKMPGWVDWIAKNKDEILRIAGVVTGLFLLIKGAEWLNALKTGLGYFSGMNVNALALSGSIAVIVANVYKWYKAQKETAQLVDNINKNGLTNNKKWLDQTSNLNDINGEINNKRKQGIDLMNEMNKVSNTVTGANKSLGETLINNANIQDQMIQKEWQMYQNGEMSEEQKKDFIKLLRNQVGYLDDSVEKLRENFQETGNLIDLSDGYEAILRQIDTDHKNIFDKTAEILNKTMKQKNETTSWWDKVSQVKDKLKEIANTSLGNKDLTIDVKANTTGFRDSINSLIGKLGAKIGLDFSNFKLASGGIINNPGRGVQLGTSIIGGEAGPEAVLPLNDTTLDNLGRAIARHMEINNTIINQMNGRTISRELLKITNENEFVGNR